MALVLTREMVRGLVEMPELVDAVESSLVQFALGRVVQPLRLRLRVPGLGTTVSCASAYLEEADVMSTKVTTTSAHNPERGLPRLSALVALCDPATGKFLAVMHGAYITEVRTAAASAVATRILALPDASVLGVLGAGVQARSHLWAISTIRRLKKVKVYDAVPERGRRYAAEMEERFGLPVDVCVSAESAVRDSDVVVAATTSSTPVLQGRWLKDGAHVNAVGAHTPDTRELDSDAVCGAKLVADSLQALFAEAGDVLIPIAEGRMTREQVYGEIGEIAAGRKQGRESEREITIFKSVGIAAEDAVAAKLVYERALKRGLGIEVDM